LDEWRITPARRQGVLTAGGEEINGVVTAAGDVGAAEGPAWRETPSMGKTDRR